MGAHRLQQDYEVSLTWTTFPLHPEIPEEGLALTDLFEGRSLDIDAMFERLRGVAAGLGLPLSDRRRTFNSRRAQELGKWAGQLGEADAFHAAVYRAYFAEGRNIGRQDELVALVKGLGLPTDEAERALREGLFHSEVDADWRRSRALGVRAVPTLLVGTRRLEGFHPYEELAALAERAGAPRRRPDITGGATAPPGNS